MFRAVRFDVTARVRRGRNRLAVCFSPTSSMVADQKMPLWSIIGDSDPADQAQLHSQGSVRLGMGLGSVAADRRHLETCFAPDGNFGGAAIRKVHDPGSFDDA